MQQQNLLSTKPFAGSTFTALNQTRGLLFFSQFDIFDVYQSRTAVNLLNLLSPKAIKVFNGNFSVQFSDKDGKHFHLSSFDR